MRFLVTGSGGFIGHSLCSALLQKGHSIRVATRSKKVTREIDTVQVGEINGDTVWAEGLRDIEVVIHLAARVHVMQENAVDPLSEFRKVNVAGTERLARAAASSGVKRFVFISSVKVNGEATVEGQKFLETDAPAPQDAYGISKMEAEQVLHRIAKETGLEVVIVRPPLVYGPKVKGNFIQMLKILSTGMPLPFASIHNHRSLIYLENLVDLLIVCAIHPAASGQTYLVNDDEDISTPKLLNDLSKGMDKTAYLLPFPVLLLKWVGFMMRKSGQVERLLGSLQVDSGKIRRELNWNPPYSLQQGLQETAKWYRTTYL